MELLTNPDFELGTIGWDEGEVGNGTVTWINDTVELDGAGSANRAYISQAATLEAGQTYRIRFAAAPSTVPQGSYFQIGSSENSADILNEQLWAPAQGTYADGIYQLDYVAAASGAHHFAMQNWNVNTTLTVSSGSVKRLG